MVLALAYYECPMLCTQVLNGMTGALKTLSFDAGKDFDVVVVSIDPKDNFRLAANKKTSYVAHYGRPATAGGWHFLTGTEASIKPLAEAIGFRYAYDANIKQYAHGAAIYVATPKGVVARYLLGIDFAPRDLRLALVEASNNQLGSVTDKVLLLCYHYDPSVGKYGVAILNAVRIGFIGDRRHVPDLSVHQPEARARQDQAAGKRRPGMTNTEFHMTTRTSAASEPRESERRRRTFDGAQGVVSVSRTTKRRARARVGEFEGRSPSTR